ncbi:PcfB family protein [bacterium D16-76]|nr:PcfB family protein [bacterium D16-76]
MDTTTEAVDELFRVTYKGITYTFRLAEALLTGSGKLAGAAAHGGAALAGIFAALKHQEYRTKGAVKFENLLQRGKGFAQFDIMERDYDKFQKAAKDCSVLYACVTMDKVNAPGERVFTIFCGRDQAEIVNHIIEVNNLTVVQARDYRQESAREATPEEIHNMTEEETRSRNRSMNADFVAEFIDKEQGREEAVNPTVLPVNATPSGQAFVNTDGGRESVRARIMAIRLQQGHVALPLPEHASPTKDDIAQEFFKANLFHLSPDTRDIGG